MTESTLGRRDPQLGTAFSGLKDVQVPGVLYAF